MMRKAIRGWFAMPLIRKGFNSGEIMVCLVINGKRLPHGEELVKRLSAVSGMTSISYSINEEKTNVIMGKEIVNLYGPGYITDSISDVTYQISPLSFIRLIRCRQKSCMEQPWNMRALREKKRYGICTAALELFPCSWPEGEKGIWRGDCSPGH